MKPFTLIFLFLFTSFCLFAETGPCRVVFLVNDSMDQEEVPLNPYFNSIELFTEKLGPEDSIALVSFHPSLQVIQDFTEDRDLFLQALISLDKGDHPSIYDGLAKAVQLFQNETGKLLVILITDSEDYGSIFQSSDIEQMYHNRNISLYSFTMREFHSQSLSRLSRSTGGMYRELSSLSSSAKDMLRRNPSAFLEQAGLGAMAGIENRKSNGTLPVLTVESTPLNSAVFIDEQFRGFTSERPSRGSDHSNQLHLQNISPGEHNIRILSLPGEGQSSPQIFEFSFSMGNMNAYLNATVMMRRATLIHSNGRREQIQPDIFMDIQNSLDKFDRMFD